MPLMQLSLATIHQVDNGKIGVAFDYELERIVRDLLDRPTDETARKITLEIRAKPIQAAGDLEDLVMEFSIRSTVPNRKSRKFTMRPNVKGQVAFSSTSLDVNQTTFDDLNEEGRIER